MKIEEKGELMNESVNYEGFCRKASATPSLLKLSLLWIWTLMLLVWAGFMNNRPFPAIEEYFIDIWPKGSD